MHALIQDTIFVNYLSNDLKRSYIYFTFKKFKVCLKLKQKCEKVYVSVYTNGHKHVFQFSLFIIND